MWEGLANEVIKIIQFVLNSDDWFWFLFFFGGTIIGIGLGATKIATQFIHSLIPEIHYTIVKHCECQTRVEGYALAKKEK